MVRWLRLLAAAALLEGSGADDPATVRYTLDLRSWTVDYLRPTIDLPNSPRKTPYQVEREVAKSALLANGMYPGPTIEANEGDWIEVTVVNNMLSENAAIHWHGIHQETTPWNDGVRGVTQGPIEPGFNYTYRFKAFPAGTHFWHAHYNAQMMDKGLKGPLIVHHKAGEDPHAGMYQEERIVALSDEWRDPDVCLRAEGALPGNPVCAEIDRGSFNGQWGNGTKEYPWPEVEVEAGKCYRFRFIGMMGQAQNFQVSIAGHPMTIIAYDGTDVEPVQVSMFNLHAGERVDVVVCANQYPGHYLITNTYDLSCFLVHGAMGPVHPTWWKMGEIDACSFYAFFKYKDSQTVPGPPAKPFAQPDGTDGGKTPQQLSLPALDLNTHDDWKLLVPLKPTPEPEEPSVRYVFDVGVKSPEYKGAETPYAESYRMYMFNEVQSWTNPSTPLLHTKGECGTNNAPMIEVPENATTVEIILNNLSPTAHVLHLHGMRFRVINFADASTTWCTNKRPDCFFTPSTLGQAMHCPGDMKHGDPVDPGMLFDTYWGCTYNAEKHKNLQFNLSAPMEKDMISLWRRSWAVIRIPNVNPGFWLFHCHMEQHIPTGQMMVFSLKKSEQLPIPPDVPRQGTCPVWSDSEAEARPPKKDGFWV